MARATEKEWAQRLARWRRSGLTAKEFATQEGLKASTLAYWRWRLKRAEPAHKGKSCAATTTSAEPRVRRQRGEVGRRDRAADFVGFELVTASAAGADVEVVVDGALRVRVASGFDEATLRRVLGVLREGAR